MAAKGGTPAADEAAGGIEVWTKREGKSRGLSIAPLASAVKPRSCRASAGAADDFYTP